MKKALSFISAWLIASASLAVVPGYAEENADSLDNLSIKGDSIYFDEDSELVWLCTADGFSERYDNSEYVLTPESDGEYYLRVDEIEDNELVQYYYINCSGGRINIEKTDEYTYDTEEDAQLDAVYFYFSANDAIKSEHYFWYDMSYVSDNGHPVVGFIINSQSGDKEPELNPDNGFIYDKGNFVSLSGEKTGYTYSYLSYKSGIYAIPSSFADEYGWCYPDGKMDFILRGKDESIAYSLDYKNDNIVPSSLDISNFINGDANNDNELSMADAVLIMQSTANPDRFGINGTEKNHMTETGKRNADIAGYNNGITNLDALAVQKKLLGLDEKDDTAKKLGVYNGKIKNVKVYTRPIVTVYDFSGDDAQKIVDFISELQLISDYEDDPYEYDNEYLEIEIEYAGKGKIEEISQKADKFIASRYSDWYAIDESDGKRLKELISELSGS